MQQFEEAAAERRFASNGHLQRAECRYWICKLQARFFAGDYAAALTPRRVQNSLCGQWMAVLRSRRISPLQRAVSRGMLRLRVGRPASAPFGDPGATPATTRYLGGTLSGEFRKSCSAGRRGNRPIEGRELDAERCTNRRSVQRARTDSSTMKPSPTRLRLASTRARLPDHRAGVPAKRPLRLSPLGCRWESPAAR